MGEYAVRKTDGAEIKIGTCESMYYLRYDDRDKVYKKPHSLDPARETNLYWRLPFPDEDAVPIGGYENYSRGLRLRRPVPSLNGETSYWEDFTDPETEKDPGNIQLRHERSGLQISVRCYHGGRLPDVGPEGGANWNGKGHSLELSSVKNQEGEGLKPVVRCQHCDRAWRYEWAEILPWVKDVEMRKRLERYASL